MDIHQVPNFAETQQCPNDLFPSWWAHLQGWLRDRGFMFIEFKLIATGEVKVGDHTAIVGLPLPWAPLPTDGFAIFLGPTAAGVQHAVVGKVEDDRFVPLFDPFPSSTGIVDVDSVCFLVPRDPALIIRMGRGLERIERLSDSLMNDELKLQAINSEVRELLGRPALSEGALLGPNGKPL